MQKVIRERKLKLAMETKETKAARRPSKCDVDMGEVSS